VVKFQIEEVMVENTGDQTANDRRMQTQPERIFAYIYFE